MIFSSFAVINYLVGKDYKIIFQTDHSVRSRNFYKILLIFIVAYYIDIFMILGFTDPFYILSILWSCQLPINCSFNIHASFGLSTVLF